VVSVARAGLRAGDAIPGTQSRDAENENTIRRSAAFAVPDTCSERPMSKADARRALEPAEASRSSADVRLPLDGRALLAPGDVEAIAEATAQKLLAIITTPPTTFGLVGARELAEGLGVSLDYVYAHATELGAMRLGSGPKARIRFDLDRARQALEARARRPNGRRRR